MDIGTLQSIFPGVPEASLQHVFELCGNNIELASTWLLENDWQELEAAGQQAAFDAIGAPVNAEALGGGGGHDDDDDDDDAEDLHGAEGEEEVDDDDDDDDEDDEDEDDEGEEDDDDDDEEHAPSEPSIAQPARKRLKSECPRKRVTQDGNPSEGESFWCKFDDTVVSKGHLQLMNLRPSQLAHSRILISNVSTESTVSSEEAERGVLNPWSKAAQEAARDAHVSRVATEAKGGSSTAAASSGTPPAIAEGFWCMYYNARDVDDIWWKILEPHVGHRRSFGSLIGIAPVVSSGRDRRIELPCFDEICAPPPPGGGGAAAAPQALAKSACLVVYSTAEPEANFKIGAYLASLFPHNSPICWRRYPDASACGSKAPTGGRAASAAGKGPVSATAVTPAPVEMDPSLVSPENFKGNAEFRLTREDVTSNVASGHGAAFTSTAKQTKYQLIDHNNEVVVSSTRSA